MANSSDIDESAFAGAHTREEFYKCLLEGSSDLILAIDMSGGIRFASESARRMLGYAPEDLVGMQVLSFIHPDDLARAQERLTNPDRYENVPVELRVRRKDGTWCDCEGRGKFTASPDRERLMVVNTTDITGRKRSERERALLAAVIRNSDEPITSTSLDGRVTSLNPSAEKLFGVSAEQALGQPMDILVPPKLQKLARRNLAEDLAFVAANKNVVRRLEVAIPQKDGSVREFILIAFGIYDVDGKPTGMSQVYHDITERKRAEREQALLAALVNSADAGMISVDLEDRLTSWNPAAEKLFGYSAEEAIGRGLPDLLVPAEMRERCRSAVLREFAAAAGGRTLSVVHPDVCASRKDGSTVEVSILVSGLYDPAGTLLGASAIIHGASERKRAEREQALLAAIVTSTDDAIYSVSPDFTVTTWNRGAEELFGFGADEAIGRKVLDLYVPAESHAFAEHMMEEDVGELKRNRRFVRHLEVEARRKDGRMIEVAITASGIYHNSGSLLGISNVVRDVTERKRAEREQALLAAIVSSTDDAVVSLSAEGVITSWNRGAEAVLGFSPAEAIGHPVTLYLPPEAHAFALESVRQQLETARRHEPIERIDLQLLRKDKTPIDATIVTSGVYDTSGNLIGLSGIIRDMTERNRNERRLAAMASIVNASQDVIISVDAKGRVIAWNPAAERVYGFRKEEVLGHGLELFVPPEELQNDLEIDRRILQTGETASFEHLVPDKDGTSLTFLVDLFPIRDAGGAIAGVGGISRDVSKLKAIENELRQAQEYTRGLIESSIDAMVVVDRELHITDGNEQLARLTEVPKKRLVGTRFDVYFKDSKLAAEAIEKTLKDGFVTNCDLVLCAASGREIMVSFSASIFYSAGSVFGIFGVARDVTDQRAIERKLAEERQYSRSLIECSPDALLVSDPAFVVTDLNDRAVEFSGYGRNELIGARLATLFTDSRRAGENIGAALEKGLVREVELSFLTRDAREVPVAMSASVYRGADRATRGLLVDLRDISEHKRYESGRALLAAIVDSSGDAIYSESTDLTITSWNAAAERLFGYSAAEIIGRNAAVLVPLDRRSELPAHLEAVEKSGKSENYETRRLRKDGTVIDVEVTTSPIHDAAGHVTGLSLTAHDISERKRMQAEVVAARDEALEAARLKSEFLASMSHEIRTPLNSIIGMTGLLLEGQLGPEQRDFAQDVRASGNTLLNLINDILDFSKVTAGKVLFEEIDFELTGAVEGAIELIAEAARQKKLELTVSIDPDCPQYLRGDPGRLRQVLVNLLGNAVKFTPQGEISVQVSKLSENPRETILRFEVRDTGIGIAKEKQHLLFRPFTQLDASTARHFGGTGLGLSISRELVERMGGTIAVTSTPGAGSTFWFTVKLAKQIDGQHRASEHFASLAGAKVLIVDDNANNREILRRTMTRWGMQAEAAESAAAALELMRRQPSGSGFRVAVIDVMMPEVDGFQLARQIKAEPQFGDPQVIFASSAGTLADFAANLRGISVGGWLLKPVPESALYKALVHVIGPPEAQPSQPPEHPRRTLSIPADRKLTALVAEDNPVNQKLARLQMARLGFQVDAVGNGREAVEALSRISYDVVLMDCQMPEMDGYEATRAIRRREGVARHTPIVAMTANALPGDRDTCIAAGMDAYISKPVELEALEKVVSEVLAPIVQAGNGNGDAPAGPPRADAAAAAPECAQSEGDAKS